MSELSEKLNLISTYRTLTDVEAEINTVKTPKNFNPNNPNHLREQLERVEKRQGLSRDTAVLAFRLEVVQSNNIFDVKTRLALLAAYDPEVRSRLRKNHNQAASRMNPKGKLGIAQRNAVRMRSTLSLYGHEGYDMPDPIDSAESLEDAIREARLFAEEYQGERIAIRTPQKNVITGIMPDADKSFALVEPVIDEHDDIQYVVPSEFVGISDLKLHAAQMMYGKQKLVLSEFPELLEKTREGLVAKPQINDIRQELGLLGVNVYRGFYLDSFTESITSEEGARLPLDQARLRYPR